MSSNQKCEFVCDFCAKKELSFSEDHLPKDWCKGEARLYFNRGQFQQGVWDKDKSWSSDFVDICNDCFENKYKSARTRQDQEKAMTGTTHKILKFFGVVRGQTYNQKCNP